MIEAEAKTMWCPFIRFSDEGADAYSMSNQGIVLHRDTEPVLITRCIASACMAWRWSRAKETASYLQAVQERMKSMGENFNVATNKVYAEIGSTFEKTEGYCGAFGEPK